MVMTGRITRASVPAFAILAAITTVSSAEPPRFPMTAGYTDGAAMELERNIAPGVVHSFESRDLGPLTINALLVDTTGEGIELDTVKAQQRFFARETVPSMAERSSSTDSRVLAATNADFWGANADPIGPFIDEGIIWKGPWRRGEYARSVFAWDDLGGLYIGLPDFRVVLRDDDGNSVEIEKINFPEDETQSVVYTWPIERIPAEEWTAFDCVVLRNPGGQWLPNDPAEVIVGGVTPDTPMRMSRETIVVGFRGGVPDWIDEGDALELEAEFGNLPGVVQGILGGIPRILVDGESDPVRWAVEEGSRESFATDLHPRTAIGIHEDGRTVVMVTVDGRQTRRSVGVSLIELAEIMRELGCTHALNFDGGGSSTMVVEGEVVNFPSDAAGARAVSNALLVRRSAPLGPPVELRLRPSRAVVPAGSEVYFGAKALDTSGEMVALRDTIVLEVEKRGMGGLFSGGKAEVEGTSVLVESAGLYQVTARARHRGVEGRGELIVREPFWAEFMPEALLMEVGGEEQYALDVYDEDGGRFYAGARPTGFTIPDFLDHDPATRTLRALRPGTGRVEVMFPGGAFASLPVAAGEYRTAILAGLDTIPDGYLPNGLELLRVKDEVTGLSLESEVVRSAPGAWRIDYGMAGGGITKIGLNLDLAIPDDAMEVGVWVYGDGQGQWLRGDFVDSTGTVYKLDFTDSANGINWVDEWRFAKSPVKNAPSLRGGATAPQPPLRLVSIYLVQPQEAAKRDGSVVLDDISAIFLPEGI